MYLGNPNKIKKFAYSIFRSRALFLTILTAISAAVILVGSNLFSSPAPSKENIEIVRDKYGIPHIYAETKEGAYYALGWTAAEDSAHVFYSEILEASGRSAEFVEALNDQHLAGMLEVDERARALDFYKHAKKWDETLPQDIKILMTAYAHGFNDYIDRLRATGKLDQLYSSVNNIDFAELINDWGKVNEVDVAAVIIASNVTESMMNLSDQEMGSLNGLASLIGSNSMAINGSLTAQGFPMLYGDVHNVWLGTQRMVSISFPGTYFAGGVQGMILHGGGSEKIAFADTRNNPDGADVYREQINPDNPMQYRHKRQWKDIEKKEVVFKVKNGTPKKKTLYFTENGWMKDFQPGTSSDGFALRLATLDAKDDPGAPLKVITQRVRRPWAENVHDIYQINKRPYVAFKSEVSADSIGNISYMYLGAIPVRAGDHNPLTSYDSSVPVEGTNIWTDWTGKYWKLGDPNFQLPYVLNPRGGVVANANNAPWYAAGCDSSRFARPAWIPNHVVPTTLDDTARGLRLREILCSGDVYDFDDLRLKLVYDTLSVDSRDFMTAIKKGWKKHGDKAIRTTSDPNVVKLHNILSEWNCRADVSEPGMSAMYHFRRYTDLPWFRADYSPTYSDMEIYVADLKKTANKMIDLYGTVEVPWGDIHVIVQGGKFIPLPGGTEQIRTLFMAYMFVNSMDTDLKISRDSMYGDVPEEDIPELRGKVICDFGSSFAHGHLVGGDRSVHAMVTPKGQIDSDVFKGSPHLAQQAELMSKNEWIVMPRTKNDTLKNACPWGNNPNHEHPTLTRLSPKLN